MHGRVTAVMGPSGAGKSTFMTTLAGKAYYGDQTGKVLISDAKKACLSISELSGLFLKRI